MRWEKDCVPYSHFFHFLVRTKANCSTLVWVTTGGDMEIINSLTDVLVTMNTPADREKLFKITKLPHIAKAGQH